VTFETDLPVKHLQCQENYRKVLQCATEFERSLNARLHLLEEVIEELHLQAINTIHVAVDGLLDELHGAPNALNEYHQTFVGVLEDAQPLVVLVDVLLATQGYGAQLTLHIQPRGLAFGRLLGLAVAVATGFAFQCGLLLVPDGLNQQPSLGIIGLSARLDKSAGTASI